ncbi:MAG: metalloregulator ArsR/SmtB family transcription factor [Pseudomonadota bacterium]
MVDGSAPSLDDVFRALSDPTRRGMIERLRAGPRTVGELAEPFSMTLAGAAKHVGVLDRAGLVARERRGREVHCALRPERLAAAHSYLEQYAEFWDRRLDVLAELLERDDERKETP